MNRNLRSWTPVFDRLYAQHVPPWDIGQPQPELVRLAQSGGISGSILDIGCGTGENVLHLCKRGLDACGLDLSQKAIEIAERKARQRGIQATFLLGDALQLGLLGRTFDTLIDCGLFHVFTEQERPQLAASVADALKPRGRYVILTFSQANGPGPWPHGESIDEITGTFQDGWSLEFIRPARFETRFEAPQARAGLSAWLASFSRLP